MRRGVIREAAAQPPEFDLRRRTLMLPPSVPVHLRPKDCTCADGHHTDAVSLSINDETLRVLIEMEECAAERRALIRCLNDRHGSLAGVRW